MLADYIQYHLFLCVLLYTSEMTVRGVESNKCVPQPLSTCWSLGSICGLYTSRYIWFTAHTIWCVIIHRTLSGCSCECGIGYTGDTCSYVVENCDPNTNSCLNSDSCLGLIARSEQLEVLSSLPCRTTSGHSYAHVSMHHFAPIKWSCVF